MKGLTAIRMSLKEGAQTRSPWEQFQLKHNFGIAGNTIRQESAKAKKKRLLVLTKTPRRKKKNKSILNELYQSHLLEDGGYIYNDAEASGDKMHKKNPLTIRCGLQNLNILPESARNYKSRQLMNHLREGEYDVFMTTEVGLYWHKLDPSDQWSERALSLPDSTAIFSNNTTEHGLSDKLQYGGVGMVASGEVKHRITARGKGLDSHDW